MGFLDLVEQIQALDGALEALAQDSAMAQRLRSIPGFGPTCVAELTGEIGPLERFASEAARGSRSVLRIWLWWPFFTKLPSCNMDDTFHALHALL